MTTLIDRTAISTAAPFDLADILAHVRVDTDEADDELTRMARTAAREFEQAAQVALLTQTIKVTLVSPWPRSELRLPIGPADLVAPPVVTVDGAAFDGFQVLGEFRPVLWSADYGTLGPDLVTIEYQAGFGPDETDIPLDIAEAIADQAALHFDGRSPMDRRDAMASPHFDRIVARYRGVAV